MKKRNPIIGIPLNSQCRLSNYDSKEVYYLNQEYTDALSKFGAMPLVLPYTNNKEIIFQQINLCDGILLPGGDDITPYLYSEEPTPGIGESNADMDRYHLAIACESMKLDKPILGICRGIQIINIVHGGNLYLDISHCPFDTVLHMQTGRRKDLCHTVNFSENSKMHQYFGDKVLTNSYHHQAINKVGDNLKVTGTTCDGLVEAVESEIMTYCVGVQWHPEIMAMHYDSMNPLFEDFIDHCR